jgi:hypothetical protein
MVTLVRRLFGVRAYEIRSYEIRSCHIAKVLRLSTPTTAGSLNRGRRSTIASKRLAHAVTHRARPLGAAHGPGFRTPHEE